MLRLGAMPSVCVSTIREDGFNGAAGIYVKFVLSRAWAGREIRFGSGEVRNDARERFVGCISFGGS